MIRFKGLVKDLRQGDTVKTVIGYDTEAEALIAANEKREAIIGLRGGDETRYMATVMAYDPDYLWKVVDLATLETCYRCGQITEGEWMRDLENTGHRICYCCATHEYSTCGACHKHFKNTHVSSQGGYTICKDCRETHTFCNKCNRVVKWTEATEHTDGHMYCDDCYAEINDFATCTQCSCILGDDETQTAPNGDRVCNYCFEQYYTYCEDCGDVICQDDAVSINGGDEYVCEDCAERYYYQCGQCGHYFRSSQGHEHGVNFLCNDCARDYTFCTDCGAIVPYDDCQEYDAYLYCSDCYDRVRPNIHDYGYKPTPIFYGGVDEGYGVEVEIDAEYGTDHSDANETANAIIDAGGDHIYLKHDGSLSSRGMEIVTHPATLDYHMNNFPWHEILGAAADHGYRSHDTDTCGLHIHASRSLFGNSPMEIDLTTAKAILLVDFWYDQYVIPFARRKYGDISQWAKKANAGITDTDTDEIAIEKIKTACGYDRYKAVNIKNAHTVEFRMFKGTLRRDTLTASIQWVDVLINYCRVTPLADIWSATWGDVFGHTEYAELSNYLKNRKILKGDL